MITVYHIDKMKVFTGRTKEVDVKDGIGEEWTRIQPPTTNSGEYAVFDGIKWVILNSYPVLPLSVPEKIQMRQLRLELNARGRLQEFEDAIPNQSNSGELQIEWEYSTEIKFSGVLSESIKSILAFSDEDHIQFFIDASKR